MGRCNTLFNAIQRSLCSQNIILVSISFRLFQFRFGVLDLLRQFRGLLRGIFLAFATDVDPRNGLDLLREGMLLLDLREMTTRLDYFADPEGQRRFFDAVDREVLAGNSLWRWLWSVLYPASRRGCNPTR